MELARDSDAPMTMFAGTELYNADVPPVTARGVSIADTDLDDALRGPVLDILWDKSGTDDLRGVLAGLVATGFSEARVKRVLDNHPAPENWRVGEALAEAFLVEHRDCEFPWPSGRDLKNPAASPAGTDLVGFQRTTTETDLYRFAFGEVKTSGEGRWPPGVMNGRHGMEKQLEDLRDRADMKDSLVKYLGHHALRASWLSCYKSATKRYLASPSDVSLFGILVRDVEAKPEDLSKRAADLAAGCPAGTSIELRGMYLPLNSISTLAERAMRTRESTNGQN